MRQCMQVCAVQVDFERLARKTADDSAAQQAVKSAAASSWAALGTLVACHAFRSVVERCARKRMRWCGLVLRARVRRCLRDARARGMNGFASVRFVAAIMCGRSAP